MKKISILVSLLMILFLLTACSDLINNESESPSNTTEIKNELIEELLNQRNETAFEAYLFALDEAKDWNAEVSLYEIPSTMIFSDNIGLPMPGYFWFFMFSTKDNPRELYIGVSEGEVAGTFEAEPLLIDELPYKLKPIFIDNLIDSDVALITCIQNGLINPQEILEANIFVDYRLINLGDNPIWSLFRSDSDPYYPMCNIDAVNKEVVSDPYEAFFRTD
jgi:hypothetical protein